MRRHGTIPLLKSNSTRQLPTSLILTRILIAKFLSIKFVNRIPIMEFSFTYLPSYLPDENGL